MKLRSAPRRPEGIPGPESLEEQRARMRVGERWCTTVSVTGYPSEVSQAWLSPLLNYPGPIDVAIHILPEPTDAAASYLKRQFSGFESTRQMAESKGRLVDPKVKAAALETSELMDRLARGESRMFWSGIYITVWGSDEHELEEEVRRVRALASSLSLETARSVLRCFEGWATTLPHAKDYLGVTVPFDTKSLACTFPFASSEIDQDGGVLYGRNLSSGSLAFCNRFSLDNYNQVILAESGKGKSYLTKLVALRSLCQDIEVLVVDPENEYLKLAEAVGGTVVSLGPDGDRVNPLDILADESSGSFFEQALFTQTVIETLLGRLRADEKALLDAAVIDVYGIAGITSDPRSHRRPSPLLADVAEVLSRMGGGSALAARLRPYISGAHRGLFDKPTSVRAEGHLVVFGLKHLPKELKPTGMLLAIEAIRKRVVGGERRPRIVVVDEAWQILGMGHALVAGFLESLARSARKHYCGLTTVTQNIGDVISTDLGRAFLTNSSSQFLLGQKPQDLEPLSKAFNLSEGECSFLASCDRGQGLLCVGRQRAAIEVLASPSEHPMVTSNPAEIDS
jgi:type IV secretory pathway VirB4 component